MARFEWPLYRFGISLFRLGGVRWRWSTPLVADPLGGETCSRAAKPDETSDQAGACDTLDSLGGMSERIFVRSPGSVSSGYLTREV
jgi:hypothetical protein